MEADRTAGQRHCDGEEPEPPEHLRRLAHVAGNGELLWPREAALEAVRWLAASGLAIWGGEVYASRGTFTAVMVAEWRTEPAHDADEGWSRYVQRSLAQALDAIQRLPDERSTGTGDAAGRSLYFLARHLPSPAPR
ncbi:MAG: hypothetical protein DLM67_18190 [Candidatus Nephthysia bennettiae]|uniref:Immunity protein 40 domain-containing protein n=1 Tax=Candidatus Nephthysia bennettiae TaxID=3127016 RepID=A0A934N9Y3_9BACT|nr:hypothetical protein [Candidatus Dormibacteraeota bacterium]MBJ7614041.1 hypothetical protein [Candidatus Dormibacteraeota bacterium]PZR90117.1 MAG: hypothetical protein DLM67_18190 [Candidatus Dormibacteraeota bacterium]